MKTCWVITNGTAGILSQALGLAEAIGFKKIEQKIFKSHLSFTTLPSLSHMFLQQLITKDSDMYFIFTVL